MKKPKKTIHERIEKLKKRAEKEGMKLVIEFGQEVNQNWSEPTFTATNPKDEWEGVEFAECVLKSLSYTVGLIYPVKCKTITCIETKIDDFNNENSQDKMFFKPSTESAYVEQLKAKAFELFGEIEEGDRFERGFEAVRDKRNVFAIGDRKYTMNGFFYKKEIDTLHFNGHSIYSKGKWAKRCKEKLSVTFDGGNVSEASFFFILSNEAKEKLIKKGYYDAGICMSLELEKYLNDEIS
jgi:hypothetical protein